MERLIAVVAKSNKEVMQYIYHELEESPPVKWIWCIEPNQLRGIDPDNLEVHFLPSFKEFINYDRIKNFCKDRKIEMKYYKPIKK